MSNTAHSTGNMASAPPRPFVIEFISMHPHERFSRFEFQHYDRLLNSMTPSELQMAVSSMTSNELYAVSQEDQDEFQNPEFLVRLLSTNAVSRPSVDAYKDRRAYQRIKDSFDEFTADGRIRSEYVESILQTVSEAIKMADRGRRDENFTTAIFSGTYGMEEDAHEETQTDSSDDQQQAQ